jgi:calcineurin-like phosphoesterase family protein
MDSYLETTWNNVVKDEDTVYFLGDLGMFRKKQDFIAQLTRLNGHIVFLREIMIILTS